MSERRATSGRGRTRPASGLVALYREAYAGFPRPVWVLTIVLLVNRAGTMVVPFLTLYLTRRQGLSAGEAGQIVALYGVGGIAGNAFAGWLCDRLGALRVAVASLVLTGLGFFALSAVDGYAGLAAAVLAVSAVAEVFRPASMTAAVELAPPALHARAIALLRLAVNLGMAIGPAVGGVLAVYSYTWLFVLDGLTCLAAAGVALVLLPVGRPAPLAAESDPDAGGAGAPRGRSPWRDGPFLAFVALATLMAIGFFQLFSTCPLHLDAAYGLDEDAIGLLIAFSAALVVVFEMPLVRTVEHRDPLALAAVGTALLCGGFALLGPGSTVAWAIAAFAVWTVGEMLVMPMASVATVRRSGARQRGRYIALYSQGWSVAFVVGPLLGTWTYENLGPGAVWWGEAALALLVPAGFLALRPAFRRR